MDNINNNDSLNTIAGSGQTTGPDGKLKDMTDEQLKSAQSARKESSGIAVKEGGSLTMPKKWRGKVKDSNTEWADWTNYGFPIHDLAHANNAAARLAQSSSYSSEEKAKMTKRIESAQKKFKSEKSSYVIYTEKTKFKLKDFKSVKADIIGPDADTGPGMDNPGYSSYSKQEVDKMMGNLYAMFSEYIGDIYSNMHNKHKDIANQMNGYIDSHDDGHMPKMHPGQIKAILEKAGISDEFTEPKPPMYPAPYPHAVSIYASTDEMKEKLKDISFKIE